MENLIVTDHARERIKQYKLNEEKVIRAFSSARRVRIKYSRLIKKNIKYSDKQHYTKYYFSETCGGILYTVKENGEQVLITVFPKKRSQVSLCKK